LLAGYSLIYRRTFKAGDRVKINDVVGDVADMRLQVTHLRTMKNEDVIVPNSVILTSQAVIAAPRRKGAQVARAAASPGSRRRARGARGPGSSTPSVPSNGRIRLTAA
jgi:hypothetical protein